MDSIKNIIFDLGGVILDIDIGRTTDAFASLGIRNVDRFFGHGFAASFFKEHEMGKISDQSFLAEIRKMTGEPISDEAIADSWNELLLEFSPERIGLLRVLKKKYRLFLFSNTNSLHYQAFQEKFRKTFPGEAFDRLFERTYYSHLIGRRKPDKSAFDFILEDSNLLASETLFIDDALVNIQGAKEAGLHTFHLQPGIDLLHVPILKQSLAI